MPQLSLHAPLFDLTLYADSDRMISVDWGWSFGQAQTPFLVSVKGRLDRYFDGHRTDLAVPTDLSRETADARKVYVDVSKVPYGHRLTYRDIAARTGIGTRRVRRILLDNPLPLLVPCHRIVEDSDDDSPAGVGPYAGGEDAPVKRELLILEGIIPL